MAKKMTANEFILWLEGYIQASVQLTGTDVIDSSAIKDKLKSVTKEEVINPVIEWYRRNPWSSQPCPLTPPYPTQPLNPNQGYPDITFGDPKANICKSNESNHSGEPLD